MSTIRIATTSLLFVIASAAGPGAADRPWLEVKSEHFTVASDGSEKDARTIAWQFEQVRTAILAVCPWAKATPDRPMLVLAPRDEAGMKTLAPKYWEQRGADHPGSVAANGADRYYAAVRADELAENVVGVNPYLGAFWSYASIAIGTGLSRQLPMWFERGLAGVLSNTNVRESDIEVGRVIPWQLQTLRAGGQRLHVRELLKVDRASPWGTFGSGQFPMFDAESWAFVHFLLFADKGAHRQQMDQFITRLLDGTPLANATDEVFKNADVLEPDFFTYIQRDVFEFGHIKVDVSINRNAFTTRAWTPAESKAKQALFLTATNRPVEAKALVEESRKLDPKVPDTYEVEGITADQGRKTDEAQAAYSKAVELGSTSYYPYYRLANLLRAGADAAAMARVEQVLDRAAVLNTTNAQVHQQLGEVKLQLGHADQAVATLERAVVLQPGSSQVRLSLARAYWTANKKEDAQRQARNALTLAATDAERARAQQLLTQYSR